MGNPRPWYYILPFLRDAEELMYLGYRRPFDVRDQGKWTMLVRVDTSSSIRGAEVGTEALALELQNFYRQSLIDVGRYSSLANPDELTYHRSIYLNDDNHDGFLFRVAGVGNLMFIHHDGIYMILVQHGVEPASIELKRNYGTVVDVWPAS